MEKEKNKPRTSLPQLPGINIKLHDGCHQWSRKCLPFRSSPQVLNGVRVTRSFVLCVCFVDRCLSFCPFLFWPLHCLFFFDVRILITPLVSSNSSYYIISGFISCHINRYVYRCVFYVFIFVLFIIFTYYCQKKLLH